MLNVIEINEMRVKQQKLLEEKNSAHQSFKEAHTRIMEDLDEQERIAHDDLIKRIKKHFKGITPSIDVTNWHVLISFNDVEFLDYRYGHTKFEGISKKLCNKIIAEYEEVYGEIEKDSYIVGIDYSTCADFTTTNISFDGIDWRPIVK